MTAARHLPRTETVQQITFGAGYVPSPQAVIVASGTTVEFVNSSSSSITLTFAPNPVTSTGPTLFANVTIAPGGSDSQTPSASAGSCNYTVTVAGIVHGPYAIQVGTSSPLIIQVTYTGGLGDCQPPTVMIPVNGKLQMNSTDSHGYGVLWAGGNGNPFNPALTSVSPLGGPQNDICQAIAPASTNPYTYSVKSSSPVAGNGGGKVIITN